MSYGLTHRVLFAHGIPDEEAEMVTWRRTFRYSPVPYGDFGMGWERTEPNFSAPTHRFERNQAKALAFIESHPLDPKDRGYFEIWRRRLDPCEFAAALAFDTLVAEVTITLAQLSGECLLVYFSDYEFHKMRFALRRYPVEPVGGVSLKPPFSLPLPKTYRTLGFKMPVLPDPYPSIWERL